MRGIVVLDMVGMFELAEGKCFMEFAKTDW